MDYSYPLLHKIFNHYKKDNIDLSNFRLYSCQHLLSPQYEMYKMFVEFGFKPENILALGKAYSSNVDVVEDIKKLGIKALQPKFSGRSFDIEHRDNCADLVKDLSNGNKNIILDDGAYLIDVVKDKNIYFAVEQTSSGFRKIDGVNLNFPVLNVARSKTKLTQESPLIARVIFERIRNYLDENLIKLPKILVIGLGPIGDSTLQIFKEENFDIVGFDVETKKADLMTYLKKERPDIVIGATGTAIMNELDLGTLEGPHIYHLISVSSSDREFPVVSFRQEGPVHQDVKYRNFVFVNNGFPITFKGNKYESTPIEIEKTIGLLLGSVLHGITRGVDSRQGVINVPEELETLINE